MTEYVGAVVSLELTSGAKVQGTVFTYDVENCALAILQQPATERPHVKVINTCFIKALTVLEKTAKDAKDKLPRGIAADATLPSLSGPDSLQKRMNKTLARAQERRRYDYADGADVSIAGCQLFDRLVLSHGSAKFSREEAHLKQAASLAKKQGVEVGDPAVVILVGGVLISDNGGAGGCSWEEPIIGEAKDGEDVSALASRVKSAVQAAFKAPTSP